MKNSLKLERLKFNSFDGDLRKYPNFKSEFTKCIQPSYKTEEAVLYQVCIYQVREEVDKIEELNEPRSRLDKRYAEKRKHIDAIMVVTENLPKYTEDDVTNIINIISSIERWHQDLVRLGLKEINNSTTVPIIKKKRMPGNLEKEWIKLATGKTIQSSQAINFYIFYNFYWNIS